jgi:hypothetical protein
MRGFWVVEGLLVHILRPQFENHKILGHFWLDKWRTMC